MLEPLRKQLELLVRYQEKGPPWSMRLGAVLAGNGAAAPRAGTLTVGAVDRLVLDPVFRRDLDEMAEFVRRMEASDVAPTARSMRASTRS